MVPMSMTETSVLFILVEAPPFDQLKIKILFKYLNQGSLLWHYSRVLLFLLAKPNLDCWRYFISLPLRRLLCYCLTLPTCCSSRWTPC